MDDKQLVATIAKDLLVAALSANAIGKFSLASNANEAAIAKVGELYENLAQSVAKTYGSLKKA